MFNNVNNPFAQRQVSSSTSSDSNGKRQKEDPKKELKKYIDEDEPDEVKIGGYSYGRWGFCNGEKLYCKIKIRKRR